MEQAEEMTTKMRGATSESLQKYSTSTQQRLVKDDNGNTQLSVYSGELTPENMIMQSGRILNAFPSLSNKFIDILLRRAKEKGFSDKRLTDAVNNVIDTCQYPNPTLANFLSYDKSVKIIDYNQLCGLVMHQQVQWESYTRIKVNGSNYYIRKVDKDRYSIPDEL